MSEETPEANDAIIQFGPFRLDQKQRLLFRDGEVVTLTPKAFEMLDLLVRNAGRVLEKERLMRGVWPDTFVDEANLSHHVFMLRRALGDDREGNRFIETIPRRGYRFVAPLAGEQTDELVVVERIQQRIVIEDESSGGAQDASIVVTDATKEGRSRRRILPATLLVIVVGLVAALVFALLRATQHRSQPQTLRFSISPPPGMTFAQDPICTELAVSPDGRTLAIVALEGRHRKLFLRSLDRQTASPIEGTEEAVSPFWSPDSAFIGFFAGGFLKRIRIGGGPVQIVCPAQGGMGSWNRDGQIIFCQWGPAAPSAIQMIAEGGGPLRAVTDEKKGWSMWPSFLPDGHHFVYFLLSAKEDVTGLYIGSIDGSEQHRIAPIRSHAEVRGEDLYYVNDSVLVRQKLDLGHFATVGDPAPIAEPAFGFTHLGTNNFSASADASVIVWQRRSLPTQLVWRDWNGKELSRVGKPDLYGKFSISPDGQRLAADIQDAKTGIAAIWVFDLDRGVSTRVLFNTVMASSPLWTPRGDTLVVSLGDPGAPENAPQLTLLKFADGSLNRLRGGDGVSYATSVTADQASLVYTVNRGRYSEIEATSLSNPAAVRKLESSARYDASDGVLSANQHWLAYQSSESGRPEVYLRPFDRAGEKFRVSSNGGTEPQWTIDGHALLFISPQGMLVKAEIAEDGRARVAKETNLFPISSAGLMELESLGSTHYAVARDRILVREIPGGTDIDPITVLVTSK